MGASWRHQGIGQGVFSLNIYSVRMYMYVNRKFMEQLSIINAPIKHIISSLDGLRVERGRVQEAARLCCLNSGEVGILS